MTAKGEAVMLANRAWSLLLIRRYNAHFSK
jgi:hypothetical protein